jgi:hypothetical protein
VRELEEIINQTKAEVVKGYGMTEEETDTKYNQIKAYLAEVEAGRSERFIVYATLARLKNYARAYKNGGPRE